VADLLATAPGLKVLVTSRIVLRVYGEHDFPVAPLAFPDPRRMPSVDGLSLYPSIALWIERAQAVKPDFMLTDQNVQAVTEICARLDGLPLAIELAAARARFPSPEAMLARLHRRLPLLTQGSRDLPIRQQTLRGSIAWSYDLLEPDEQALFIRLSVFAGGFTLDAAEMVGTEGGDLALDVMDGTASLMDKSLLRLEAQGDREPRFDMLETIREFALEQLEKRGEAAATRRRHAEYYMSLAEQAEPQLHTSQQVVWSERLEREHGNFRSALGWCIESGEAELGLRLGGAVWSQWALRGYLAEGRGWLDQLLALSGASAPTMARAKALCGAGLLAWCLGDLVAARERLDEDETLWRSLGDQSGLGYVLALRGLVCWSLGDLLTARALWDEALEVSQTVGVVWGEALVLGSIGRAALFRGDLDEAEAYLDRAAALHPVIGDRWTIAQTLNSQGDLERLRGNYGAAQAHYEESLTLAEELGGKITIAGLLQNLGHLALSQADSQQAADRFGEALTMFRDLGDRPGSAACLIGLAGVAGAEEQFARAAGLLGAAERLRDEAGATLSADDRARHDLIEAAARDALGAEAFTAAQSEGRAKPLSYP
jgi:predicted ATPase